MGSQASKAAQKAVIIPPPPSISTANRTLLDAGLLSLVLVSRSTVLFSDPTVDPP
jgi:hypothetical protein